MARRRSARRTVAAAAAVAAALTLAVVLGVASALPTPASSAESDTTAAAAAAATPAPQPPPSLRQGQVLGDGDAVDDDDEGSRAIALFLGYTASFMFTLQYMPQAWENYRRKSVRGFSTVGIIIKLGGASFLFINALTQGERLPVTLYGLFNVLQHSAFILQFTMYERDPRYLRWLLFPLLPLVLSYVAPTTLALTNSFKPLAQVASHLPQLKLSWDRGTTHGVSLWTQHLNIVGGMCGLYMCVIVPPKAVTTYLIYLNSCMQAVSLYALAWYFDGSIWNRRPDIGDLGDFDLPGAPMRRGRRRHRRSGSVGKLATQIAGTGDL